jgi:hypothetical protein
MTVRERHRPVARLVLPMDARDVRPRDPCRTVLGGLQSRRGRRTSGGQVLQTRVKRGGHPHGVRFGEFRPLPSEEFLFEHVNPLGTYTFDTDRPAGQLRPLRAASAA